MEKETKTQHSYHMTDYTKGYIDGLVFAGW